MFNFTMSDPLKEKFLSYKEYSKIETLVMSILRKIKLQRVLLKITRRTEEI